ncbi:MAG: hypothetical protein OXM61_16430 [Candidatus Poribacteria bacterium]|nr:hypothetical protein [Candidatus Poribacteria bacterium]
MYKNAITIIITLLFFVSVCPAADISVEELIGGVNKARLTIKSGEVYSKTIEESEAQKTEEEIAELIKTEKEKELQSFTSGRSISEADIERYEKEYLKASLEDSARRYRKHKDIIRTTTLFKVLSAGDLSHKPQYQYKLTRVDSPGVPLDEMSSRFRPSDDIFLLVYDKQTQVQESIGDIIFSLDDPSAISFYDRTQHVGYPNLHFSGRSGYFVPPDAKHVGTEKIDGVECHILAFTIPNNRRLRIWVDPKKDYAVHRVDHLPLTIELVVWRSVFKQFVKYGDIWFPQVHVGNSFFRDGRIKRTITDEVIDAEFNVDFPDGFFEFEREYYKPPDMR